MKWLIAIVFYCSILFLGYCVHQNDFYQLFIGYTVAFASFAILYQKSVTSLDIRHLVILGIVVRLSLIPSWPHLSDDIYRFIWDGNMINHGLNPFSALPTNIVGQNLKGLSSELMGMLNSCNYFSVYPTVCQAVFWISTLFDKENWILSSLIIKIILFLSEIGLIAISIRWLKELQSSPKKVLLYVLNPLVIIEIMGNVHFEGVMAFFLIASLFAFYKRKLTISGVLMALSISTKFIPLMLLPTIAFKRLKDNIKYWLALGFSLVVLLGFICAGFYQNEFYSSIALYFRTFEFNASLYYLARSIGIYLKGYNMIAIVGPLLASLATFIIILASWHFRRLSAQQLPSMCLFILTIYFFFATTVHPWYLITLLSLSVFTEWKYPLIWSYLIVLSYHAYMTNPVYENPWIIGLEYGLLCLAIILELRRSRQLLSMAN